MKVVAKSLVASAANCQDDELKERLYRSAFNRFYYYSFLKVRSTLKCIDPTWGRDNHANMPDKLRNGVKNYFKKNLDSLKRKDVISSGEYSRAQSAISDATLVLSGMLDEMYRLRCVADYQPEDLVSITNGVVTLKSVDISLVERNCKVVDSMCDSIIRVYEIYINV